MAAEGRERLQARRLLSQRSGRDMGDITEAEVTAEVARVEEYSALLDSPITHDEAARLAWPATP